MGKTKVVQPVDIEDHQALRDRVDLLEIRVWAVAGMSFVLGAGLIISIFL